jgi:DNA-binding transcriptional ArsR family regulator
MHEDTQACGLTLDSPYVELAVEVFSMLADATRVRIILALRTREMAVGELAGAVGKSPTAVSQHLAKLRLARMVATRQDGNRVYYRLVDEHARQLVTTAIFQAQHAVDEHPAHHHGNPGPGLAATATETAQLAQR